MGSLRSAIEEWAVEEISSLSDHELSDQIVELDAAISSLECQRAQRLSVFGKRQAGEAEGHASGTAFLSEKCRMSPSRAKGLLSQAESLSQMPETMAAWAEDRLSLDQTRQLVSARDTNPDLRLSPQRAQRVLGGVARRAEGGGELAANLFPSPRLRRYSPLRGEKPRAALGDPRGDGKDRGTVGPPGLRAPPAGDRRRLPHSFR